MNFPRLHPRLRSLTGSLDAPRSPASASARAWTALRLATAAACLAWPVAHAQTPGGVQVKLGGGFNANIGDGNRLVARVSGKEAAPTGNQGAMRITAFKLETFRDSPQREVELHIESPEGIFDQRAGASSSRTLTLRSTDQRFAISGEGWSWDRTTGNLVISNQVEALLQRGAGTHTPAAPTSQVTTSAPVTVRASRLEYNLKSGDTRFSGGSTATEPGRAQVSAQEIVTRLAPGQTEPESISALGGVTIELLRTNRTGRVTGSAARYGSTAEGEVIEVEGPATWSVGAIHGQADALRLLPARETYAARGNVRLRLASTPKPGTPARPPLEISAELVDAQPAEIAFEGHVFARQPGRLELQADRLRATLAEASPSGTGSPDRDRLRAATATGDVIARILSTREPVEIRGAQLVYTLAETARLEITGKPSWSLGSSTGTAALLVALPDVPEFQASGDVVVAWRGATNHAAPPRTPIRLAAQTMKATRDQVQFAGGVRAGREGWDLRAAALNLHLATNGAIQLIHTPGEVDLDYRALRQPPSTNSATRGPLATVLRDVSEEASRWKLHAATMQATLDPVTQDLSQLDASGGVTIDQLAVHARSTRLSYQPAESLLRLFENAEVRSADGLEIVGEPGTSLTFDPRDARFQVDGPVRKMRLPARALKRQDPAAPPRQP
ncbi:MAG: hypothetical protein IT580_01350 [Verrucomicrobiales bacterium]|nr:hypothetical protein [Verrucomicrobiales bacterium]